mmetsp:Transcript_57325/g.68506  ORF Transcript_57325/g.68506 Transcript_57325/m.68506 type:complete len:171 (-) Transcript_57325:112-624(-)
MKIEPNACFKTFNDHLPRFRLSHLAYHAAYGGYEPEGPKFVNKLVLFTEEYMKRESTKPRSPTSWQFLQNTWQHLESFPIFSTHLEVISKSFMQRKDVMKFHRAITEHDPFGMWLNRWSVHALRYVTMAVFAEDEKVMKSQFDGFHMGKQQCDPAEVDDALEYFGLIKRS